MRTPHVDHHQVAALIAATSRLRADPAALLAEQTRTRDVVVLPGRRSA